MVNKITMKKEFEEFFSATNVFSDIRLICKNDEFSTLLYANQNLYDFIGYDEKEFYDKYRNRFSEIIFDFLYREIVSMLDDCEIIDMKFRIKHKSGELIWVSDQAIYDKINDVFLVCLKPHIQKKSDDVAGVVNTNELTYKEISTYIFDALYDYTIIIDLDTEELFYLSDSIIKALNNPPGIYWKDKKLSQIFDLNDYVSTKQIGTTTNDNGYEITNVYSEKHNKYFEIKEKVVPLKKRNLLIKLISDVTLRVKEELNIMTELELQKSINNCVQILHNKVTDFPIVEMLDEVLKFYNADSVFILNYSDITRLYNVMYESSLNDNHLTEGVLSINFHNVCMDIIKTQTIVVDLNNINKYVLYDNKYFNNLIISNVNYNFLSKGNLICVLNSKKFNHRPDLVTHVSKFISNYFRKETIIDDLNKQVEIDNLTGLYNKINIQNKIIQLLLAKKVNNGALYFFDLDAFKDINDKYGHLFGDKLLQQFSKQLKSKFKGNDLIGRVGGDEFLVFVYNYKNDFDPLSRVDELIKDLVVEYDGGDGVKEMQVSVGINVIDGDDVDFNELYHKADLEMYKCKRAKKGS